MTALRTQTIRRDRSLSEAGPSTPLRRTKFVPRTEFVRPSARKLAAATKKALKHYSEGEVAQIADVSKETAQSWKLGRRCPHWPNAMDLAAVIPEMEAVVDWAMGRGEVDQEKIVTEVLNRIAQRGGK